MSDGPNQVLYDLDVAHQIGLERLSAATTRKVMALLERSRDDVVERIKKVGFDEVTRESAKLARLERLLEAIRETQVETYKAATKEITTDMLGLAPYEVEYQANAVRQATRGAIDVGTIAKPTAEDLKAAVNSRPFQGRLLKEWGKDTGEAALKRIRDQIRIGYTQGESIPQIVSRVQGTAALRFNDGVSVIARRDMEGVVRTAVTHTANSSKDLFFKANAEVFRGVRWTSVLDGRTTAVCRGRDGTVYPLDSGPRPPAHWRCRSTTVAVLKGESDTPIAETYDGWLKRQDRDLQDDVLGVEKAKLWRDGGLELDRFVNRAGREYNLAELRKRETEAFTRAGLQL